MKRQVNCSFSTLVFIFFHFKPPPPCNSYFFLFITKKRDKDKGATKERGGKGGRRKKRNISHTEEEGEKARPVDDSLEGTWLGKGLPVDLRMRKKKKTMK
uniref:Uncharacterized protein n=1 Tax=Bracon brevicornis TaxID=1563983 RepID=A0A6V7HST0_9HYME